MGIKPNDIVYFKDDKDCTPYRVCRAIKDDRLFLLLIHPYKEVERPFDESKLAKIYV